MNSYKRSKISWVIIILLFLTACASGIEQNTAEADLAPNFVLEQINGQPMTLNDTQGKTRLVYFYFSSCVDVCLPTTHLLSKVQEELKQENIFGTDTSIYSITFDPVIDTAERLQEFSGFYNTDHSGWHFLRGDETYIREVALEYGVSVIDLGDGQFAHHNIIFLVNPLGYIQKYYNANDLDLEAADIVNDMKALLKL